MLKQRTLQILSFCMNFSLSWKHWSTLLKHIVWYSDRSLSLVSMESHTVIILNWLFSKYWRGQNRWLQQNRWQDTLGLTNHLAYGISYSSLSLMPIALKSRSCKIELGRNYEFYRQSFSKGWVWINQIRRGIRDWRLPGSLPLPGTKREPWRDHTEPEEIHSMVWE